MQGTVGLLRPVFAVGNRIDLKMLPSLLSYLTESNSRTYNKNLVEFRCLRIFQLIPWFSLLTHHTNLHHYYSALNLSL